MPENTPDPEPDDGEPRRRIIARQPCALCGDLTSFLYPPPGAPPVIRHYVRGHEPPPRRDLICLGCLRQEEQRSADLRELRQFVDELHGKAANQSPRSKPKRFSRPRDPKWLEKLELAEKRLAAGQNLRTIERDTGIDHRNVPRWQAYRDNLSGLNRP